MNTVIWKYMDDRLFQTRADSTLEQLYRALGKASEAFGFETDFNSGALTVEFEDPPGKFVISPNAPVRQIWVSAHLKSYKLDWDDAKSTFIYPAEGVTLTQLIEQALSKQLGETVSLQ